MYKKLWIEEKNEISGEAYGRRKLRNLALFYMMKAYEEEALVYCVTQFDSAQNMTDKLAAFALLVSSSNPLIADKAIESFYQQYKDDDLVLDKWFSIQATATTGNILERVKTLLEHKAFSLKNPNKVRALLGAFTNNPLHFHAKDGSGYVFLREQLERLDTINPQIAARLATPFSRYARYDKERQALMQKELQTLSAGTLSKDLGEVVSKSLL